MARLFLIACLTLAACGADGEPEPPTRAISGEIAVGVVVK
jgi:hypothetical protein